MSCEVFIKCLVVALSAATIAHAASSNDITSKIDHQTAQLDEILRGQHVIEEMYAAAAQRILHVLKPSAAITTTASESPLRVTAYDATTKPASATRPHIKSCASVQNSSMHPRSGAYDINWPDSGFESFVVQCSTHVSPDDKPWLMIQLNLGGMEDPFPRSWSQYRYGFQDDLHTIFLGLDRIHALTTQGEPQELRINLLHTNGKQYYAHYDRFAIGGETENYALKVLGNYTGTAGDALSFNRGREFSTWDYNHNAEFDGNCAEIHGGGWWFGGSECTMAFLNTKTTYEQKHPFWNTIKDGGSLIRASVMAIRPSSEGK